MQCFQLLAASGASLDTANGEGKTALEAILASVEEDQNTDDDETDEVEKLRTILQHFDIAVAAPTNPLQDLQDAVEAAGGGDSAVVQDALSAAVAQTTAAVAGEGAGGAGGDAAGEGVGKESKSAETKA